MKIINHAERFTTGTRVLMLKGRHKDGITEERTILRVSNSTEEFNRIIEFFCKIANPAERIYASAGSRNVKKAARLFKERQLAASYDQDEDDFYHHLEARWCSCLMAPTSQEEKFWLFDCDAPEDNASCFQEYNTISAGNAYTYNSKSGTHTIVKPFDKSKCSDRVRALIHDNAIMLWGY
jgi:hypothetical protein